MVSSTGHKHTHTHTHTYTMMIFPLLLTSYDGGWDNGMGGEKGKFVPTVESSFKMFSFSFFVVVVIFYRIIYLSYTGT